MKILQTIFVLSCIIWECTGHGQRSMPDQTYDVILQVLKGEFNVPVAERSRIQRAALVRLWRNRQHYGLSEDGKAITFDGKLVVRKSTIPAVVNKILDETKGSGVRKLNIHLREQYSGISRASVQETLDGSRRYQLHKATFGNKPIPKSIIAKVIQDRHQIDLLDMGKWRVKHGKATYRYILTIVDVFSRYTWLRPLKSKHSIEIARHLEEIYTEHGPPKIIQHDQGKEFKGAVQKLMESLQVKIIRSSPYHPQSQGKVERSHRVLRKKIMYDLVNFQQGGVNWVNHLPVYARVMNEDPKEVLGWMSPFQVYYGRQSHRLSNRLTGSQAEVHEEHYRAGQRTLPNQKQRLWFEDARRRTRRRAQKATERCVRRKMLSGSYKPSIYRVNDNVLVKVKTGNHRVSQRHFVIPGLVVNRNLKLHKYKVQFQMANSPTPTQKCFFVSDVTSVTRREERQRPKSQPKTVKQRHLLIPYTHDDRLEFFESSNLNIHLDPIPDGNCQFAAIADQLATIGIFRSVPTLREEIVADLTSHPYGVDGTSLSEYVEGTLGDYLQRMSQHGTHGDHLTLQRASQIFNVQFLIVSTLGLDATTVISPSGSYCETLPLLVLGHFAEEQGEHYVSLDGPIHPYVQAIQEAEMHSLSFDLQPGDVSNTEHCPLSQHEPGCLSDAETVSMSDVEPGPLFDAEADSLCDAEPGSKSQPGPGPLPQPGPGLLDNPEVQSGANLVADRVRDVGNEPGVQYLPSEILSKIIELSLHQDMSMLGTFNRVSLLFRELATPFQPNLYIRDTLAESLELDKENDCTVSIMKLYKAAGRNSGLSTRIKELFSQNNRWMRAWILLSHIAFGQYKVKDIYWK